MERKKYSTLYLLKSTGSKYLGMGTILNIGGNYFNYNYSGSALEADRIAIENDWGVVGNDIAKALSKLEREIKKAKAKQLTLNF